MYHGLIGLQLPGPLLVVVFSTFFAFRIRVLLDTFLLPILLSLPLSEAIRAELVFTISAIPMICVGNLVGSGIGPYPA